MDIKNKRANALAPEIARLSNIPNAQTQAAMRDADAWVVEMRAKESNNIQSKASLHSVNFTPEI